MKAAWEKLIGKEVIVTLKNGDISQGILQKNIIKRTEFLSLWVLEGKSYELIANFSQSEIESINLS